MVCVCALGVARCSASAPDDPIPILRCDTLPVVIVGIDGADMRFLLDTGATTVLNIKSFSHGRSTKIRISSWRGTAATSAREVLVPELKLGSHRLQNLTLPAIDLSPIAEACGGTIDGLLGIDLLERTGATIDLQKRVATLGAAQEKSYQQRLAIHQAALAQCVGAFNAGRTEELKRCFDPDIVLYTPWGEFRGREQVVEYLQKRFFAMQPRPKYQIIPHEFRVVGDAVWQDYEYKIDSPELQIHGRGMMICRENNGTWQLLNMHNSFVQPPTATH